ncbi:MULTISPECIES: hypothetical protein [Marinobacter]|uniref:hypothetical protein n=1 Tax=Marinobacter TaxID=2742 RepID=UPI0010FEE457|nr:MULTISPECIES: hypothetical protein [unclassified Marinobacter]
MTFTTPTVVHLNSAQSTSTFGAHILPTLSMENANQDVLQIIGMTPVIDQLHIVNGPERNNKS